MEWKDEGLVLGTRAHGEMNSVLEIMTRNHGRRMGLVRGGRSHKLRSVLQTGNLVEVRWTGRLEEHLGFFQAELIDFNHSGPTGGAVAIMGLWIIILHLRLLPERDSHSSLYDRALKIIPYLNKIDVIPDLIARFELAVLAEMGFALDLQKCVVTGDSIDLAYVSPRSGCAVSRKSGEPWKDKLLSLPKFLVGEALVKGDITSLKQAFSLTGFFLRYNIYEPRCVKEPRERSDFLKAIEQEWVCLPQDKVA